MNYQNSVVKFTQMMMVILTLLFLLQGQTSAQTGAPPPHKVIPVAPVNPGMPIVPVTYPVVLPIPSGTDKTQVNPIPPVVGDNGTIAVVPVSPDQNAVGQVNSSLANGGRLTLDVPTNPDVPKVVRIQELTGALPAPLPENLINSESTVLALEINIYDANTFELLTSHNPPLRLAIAVPEGVDPYKIVIIRYDKATKQYQVLETIVDPIKRTIVVLLPHTSTFMIIEKGAAETIIPLGLPNTGDGSTTPSLTWLWLTMLGFSLVLAIRYARQLMSR